MLDLAFANAGLQHLIEHSVKKFYCDVGTKLHLKGSVKDLMFLKERRYASKLLTVVLRDFPQFLTGGRKDLTKLKFLAEKVWTLSLQNLTYILPFYMERVLYPQPDSVDIEDQDIEF